MMAWPSLATPERAICEPVPGVPGAQLPPIFGLLSAWRKCARQFHPIPGNNCFARAGIAERFQLVVPIPRATLLSRDRPAGWHIVLKLGHGVELELTQR